MSKVSRENVSVENGGLRGSSIAGLQGKAEQDNSQARTKRSTNIPFQWKGRFCRTTAGFGKSLIYQSFVFGKEIIDGHSPAAIIFYCRHFVPQHRSRAASSNELNIKVIPRFCIAHS